MDPVLQQLMEDVLEYKRLKDAGLLPHKNNQITAPEPKKKG